MSHRSYFRLCALAAGICLAAGSLALRAQDDSSHHMRKYKSAPPAAHVVVTVVRDYNGKPISQAHVIFHPIEGDSDKGSMELKTNDEGKSIVDVIPIGDLVRLHVLAKGFQTFGQDYKIDKPEILIEVRLKRPGAQYSIYKNSGAANSGTENKPGAGSGSGSNPSPDASQNAASPASSDKPEAQPSADQPQSQPR